MKPRRRGGGPHPRRSRKPPNPPETEPAGASTMAAAVPSRDVPLAAIREAAEPIGTRLLIGVDIGCLIVTVALAIAVLLGADGVSRLLLALAFTTVVPGWALVRGLGLASTATGAVMAIPSSLAICAGASVVMVWVNAWHPLMLLAALAAVSAAVIGWMLRVQFSKLSPASARLART